MAAAQACLQDSANAAQEDDPRRVGGRARLGAPGTKRLTVEGRDGENNKSNKGTLRRQLRRRRRRKATASLNTFQTTIDDIGSMFNQSPRCVRRRRGVRRLATRGGNDRGGNGKSVYISCAGQRRRPARPSRRRERDELGHAQRANTKGLQEITTPRSGAPVPTVEP